MMPADTCPLPGESRTDASPDARLRRLRMRSWRRGTREMDLVLGPFADSSLTAMDGAALDAFEAVLDENDQDLYAWISGAAPLPDRLRPTLDAIAAHARDRLTPDLPPGA